jgi:hypothetical protein
VVVLFDQSNFVRIKSSLATVFHHFDRIGFGILWSSSILIGLQLSRLKRKLLL